MTKLRKIQVTKGVYWVEAQDARVYILCGCPADSVKYLMKRGLIVHMEEKGVSFETGPNAILLSDILVQNGTFVNLAEFPVLQMLYMQGMILPNHPNNTGLKPLLIGSKEQVKAQMQYIYRGNYGLVSEEEIIDTGETPEMAYDMMRLKMKFAFGKIRDTEELLDFRIVENEPVEIRNGVTIRRLDLNVFEFQYQGESVKVDLNLKPGEHFEVPYPLGYHQIKREYFAVVHSGEGNGWDVNRPCMSSILMFQGKIYLIDAGPNVLHSLTALGISVNEIEGIFHTHGHDDHFAGITTLLRADRRIKYYATPLVRSSITKKLSALASIEEKSFYDYFEVHDLDFDIWNDIQGLEVKPLFSPHSVETSIFFFRTLWEGGYRTYAHFADISSFAVLKGMITKNPSEIGITQSFFDHIKNEYLIKVNLKKIDIGGGLIHGQAEDFQEDPSNKLILSHTSRELTIQEKKIGSEAAFGIVDTLIPTSQNYMLQYAFEYLQSYFPSAPSYQLKILLNNPLLIFNPGSILIKSEVISEDIYLVLTGNVELISSETDELSCVLSAGALVGEICGLLQLPATGTYRAASFVQVLRLPANLYFEFVKRNGLYANIERLQDIREFFKTTWLFGEALSDPIQNKIAKSIEALQYSAGKEFIDDNQSSLFLIRSGKVQRFIGKEVFETISTGNFFGEDVLFGSPYLFGIRALEPTEAFRISGEELLHAPIVRWKLFETFKKRRRSLLNRELASLPVFVWREEYSVRIREMDKHHWAIFEKANKLYEAIDSDKEIRVLGETLTFLIDYTSFHFTAEQDLMKQHDYPQFENHLKEHQKFHSKVIELQESFKGNKSKMKTDILDFFKGWFIDHILTEDRKYSDFLNKKGVS